MTFSRFSVKNSLFVNLISLVIIIGGIFALLGMRKEAFPPVSFNAVIVTTRFRGASADTVERLVTSPLEREIKEVNNIDEMISASYDGMSTIQLKLNPGINDTQKVVNDVQKAVDRVNDLPAGVEDRPVVTEITSGEMPVIKVSVSGCMDEFVLRKHADRLKDMLEDITGVSSVDKIGWRDEEYWVEPDAKKMLDSHVSFTELAESLRLQNAEVPAGSRKYNGREFKVKIKNGIKTKKDIEKTIIRANDLGNPVRVRDIAYVRHAFKDESELNKVFGTRAVILTVIKREEGDIIKIVKHVHDIIREYKKDAPPELKIAAFYDMAYYVKRRLHVLSSNGIIGFIFVIIILFTFLPPVCAFMTALGIPIAFFITFWLMSFFGITVNLITMFGLVMVLGIIVDDGIIISENVYRHIEQGMPPKDAAVDGTDEVARPVLSTVLTTIVAFCPLMFMSGIIGQFVKYIPIVVIIALCASVMEAFVVLPSHLADFARPLKGKGRKKESRWFVWLIKKYSHLLRICLDNKYKIFAGVCTLFIIFVVSAKLFMPFTLFTAKGVEQFAIRLEAESGVSLNTTNSLIAPVEKLVSGMPKEYMDTYETIVGKLTEERGFDPNARIGNSLAQVNVYLTPLSKRDKTAAEIMDLLRPGLAKILNEEKGRGVKKLYFQPFKEGPPVGKAVDIRVRGDKFRGIMKIVKEIKEYMSGIDGIRDISDSYDLGIKEINIGINEEKAKKAYLDNTEIAYALRAAFSGVTATSIRREKAEKEIKVLVRLPETQRNGRLSFDRIYASNRMGNLIPLSKVIDTSYSRSLRAVGHIAGRRFVSVTSDVDPKKITSFKAGRLIKERFKDIPERYPGYSISFGGENKETADSLRSLLKAFLIAVLLIFVILASQFNSLIQPFIVMLAIPFGLIGVIAAFLIHREPFSFLAIMGFIGLTGMVVNDSIVLVDFINKRKDGMPIRQAVYDAGLLRFRPVLLTTITTVCGLATVAYGIGGFDPFLRPMALAISWGLLFATGITLIVIPCVYLIIDDINGRFSRRRFTN